MTKCRRKSGGMNNTLTVPLVYGTNAYSSAVRPRSLATGIGDLVQATDGIAFGVVLKGDRVQIVQFDLGDPV